MRHQVRATGHMRMLWKSDQEPAMLALKNNVQKCLPKVQFIMEESAVQDSQGNGAIEKANHLLANQVRVLKSQLEADFEMKFEATHPIITLLIIFAVVSYNFFHVNYTGRIGYELARARKLSKPVLWFGKNCHYMPMGKTVKQSKIEPKWSFRIFVGMLEHSLEYLIVNGDGTVCKCRDVKRLVQGSQFGSKL
eukprot:932633-Amphidinium_carterae.1